MELVIKPVAIKRLMQIGFQICFLLVVVPLSATTMIAFNLAQLSISAEEAFVIRIDSVETTTSNNKSVDLISGTIIDPVFGNIRTSETKTWTQARLNSSLMLPAIPKYEVGKEYLIFLAGPGPKTGFQSPMALGQGTFSIIRNPTTGAAIARNAYNNTTLAAGLDIEAVAEDMLEKSPGIRAMTPAQRADEVQKKKMQLRGGPATSLQTLKEAAQFFRQRKSLGNNPALDYLTTMPVRTLH